MAESHIISGLVSKRAELTGLIDRKQKEIDQMVAEVMHLDATIKLFNPKYNLNKIKGRRPYRKSHLFRQSECHRLVLDTLRQQDNATLEMISVQVMGIKRFAADQKEAVIKNVLKTLKKPKNPASLNVTVKLGQLLNSHEAITNVPITC
jgi:hypothetical protein